MQEIIGYMNFNKWGLIMNNTTLKLIAIVSMMIDHIGAVLYPDISLFRVIGRLAFPIFAFLLVEGYHYTRNQKNYLIRLLLFAFISEIPFDLAFNQSVLEFSHQNVFFTLFLGLVAINIYNKYKHEMPVVAMVSVGVVALMSMILMTDYGLVGIFIIISFEVYREEKRKAFILVGLITIVMAIGTYVQAVAIVSFIPIYFYNGKKGANLKYLFYIFYPIHLLVLYMIVEMT